MKKIKILFFITSLSVGGAEKVLINLLNVLDSEKYDISVFMLKGGVNERHIPEHIRKYKILKEDTPWLKRRIIYHLPKALFYHLYVPKNSDIEVAFLEGIPTKIISTRRNKSKKITFVHMDPSKDNTFERMYRSKKQCIKQYNCYDKVCFVSEGVKTGFEEQIGRLTQGMVIHNILDFRTIDIQKEKHTEIKFSTKGLKIVVVGRLTAVKGVDRVIRVASVLQKLYDMEIIVVGTGEEYDHLNKLMYTQNVNCIRFVGYQSNPYNIMLQADMLLISSIFEGYCTVACEAIYLGVPVLTTECAGMREILADGMYGMIVDNSEAGIQKGLESILRDSTILETYKKNIVESKTTKNKDDITREYDELFESLV